MTRRQQPTGKHSRGKGPEVFTIAVTCLDVQADGTVVESLMQTTTLTGLSLMPTTTKHEDQPIVAVYTSVDEVPRQ